MNPDNRPRKGEQWNDYVQRKVRENCEEQLALKLDPAIEVALHPIKERLDKRDWYKWIAPVFSGIVSGIAVWLTIGLYILPNQVENAVSKQTSTLEEKISKLDQRLTTRVDALFSKLLDLRLNGSLQPATKNVKWLANMTKDLEEARAMEVKLDPVVLRNVWQNKPASIAADEQAKLLSEIASSISVSAPSVNLSLYSVWPQSVKGIKGQGIKEGKYYNYGTATPGKHAEIRLLTDPPSQMHFERILLEDGFQLLDGFFIRNVTYLRTVIRYRGGGFRLENVSFVDCRFEFLNQPSKPREFGEQLLTQLPGPVSISE